MPTEVNTDKPLPIFSYSLFRGVEFHLQKLAAIEIFFGCQLSSQSQWRKELKSSSLNLALQELLSSRRPE
jgi:hypothetical protein